MLVKEYMTPNPMSVSEDSSILETADLMKKHKIRRFPVHPQISGPARQ
jgi:CBS domain-containing protein